MSAGYSWWIWCICKESYEKAECPNVGHSAFQYYVVISTKQFYAHLKKEGWLIRTDLYGKGLSDRMVRMCHAKCWVALDQAVQENLIRTNPAIGCKLLPKRGREMQVLSRA